MNADDRARLEHFEGRLDTFEFKLDADHDLLNEIHTILCKNGFAEQRE